jgi:hypothetical protein
MPWQRKYDFQSGTKISSSQVDEEFNQLIAAVNQVQTDDTTKDTSLRAIAQLTKITNDTGAMKLSITNATKNLLTELVALGVGLHTFYAVDGTVNLPNGKSTRGIFHQTSSGHGWVLAYDYDNKAYINYLSTGTWLGWRRLVTDKDTQDELWSGVYFMQEGQTVTPTKKLTDCRNGWILVWSDYDDVGNKANNYDFHYSYVPKFIATKHNGSGHLFSVPRTPDGLIVKYVNIANDKITGVAGNELPDDNDVVLRYVLEW